MLTLTFCTGIVDAVGFLGLDQVFTGNMTGNIVILGMAVAGADHLPVIGPVTALAGFMVGATLAGRTLKNVSPDWSYRVSALAALTALIEICIAAMFLAMSSATQGILGTLAAGFLGLAMGMQAVAARAVAVQDVTTVVITSTITGLAADSALGTGSRTRTKRRLAAIVAILLGAVSGAAMLQAHIGIGLMAAGMLTACVAATGHCVLVRRPSSSPALTPQQNGVKRP